MKIKKVNENSENLTFTTLKKAKQYCITLGDISDIKFIENKSGYAFLEATQYLLKINDKNIFCGGSFSDSKARTIYSVYEIDDISKLKLRDDTGYPKYMDVKLDFYRN